jgi:hypothetical protein
VDLQALIHTHKGHSTLSRNFNSNHGRERRGGETLAFLQELEWGRSEEEEREEPA